MKALQFIQGEIFSPVISLGDILGQIGIDLRDIVEIDLANVHDLRITSYLEPQGREHRLRDVVSINDYVKMIRWLDSTAPGADFVTFIP